MESAAGFELMIVGSRFEVSPTSDGALSVAIGNISRSAGLGTHVEHPNAASPTSAVTVKTTVTDSTHRAANATKSLKSDY
jgi:hypothetical protein